MKDNSMASEQTLCIKLVQAVERHPCLYNYHMAEYTRKDLSDIAWGRIGQELGEDAGKMKEKWRNIRTVFTRHMKFGPNGFNKRRKQYYLNEFMKYLIPFTKCPQNSEAGRSSSPLNVDNMSIQETGRPTYCVDTSYDADNSQMQDGDSEVYSGRVEFPTEMVEVLPKEKPLDIEAIISNSNRSDHDQKRKRKREESPPSSEGERFLQSGSGSCPLDDPKRAFLMSLLPDLRSLNEREMRKFKRKVLEVVDDIIDSRQTEG